MSLKNNISLKMTELGLKLELFYFRKIIPNKTKILAVIIILCAAALITTGIIAYHNNYQRYFYIDYEGNRGVANWCGTTEAGLVCDRTGGRIMVNQYWKGR